MLVIKFGGTSVGTPERMMKVATLVSAIEGRKIVVLSAVSGTTNTLVEISNALMADEQDQASQLIDNLEKFYNNFSKNLFKTSTYHTLGEEIISRHFSLIRLLAAGKFDERSRREMLAQGELLSTEFFHAYLNERDVKSRMLPALHFMSIDEDNEPELEKISERLRPLIKSLEKYEILITQGYICRNHKNEIDNLKRGGSDYTASLIGAAVRADEIQIWTDIDGMHNNDPRIVKNTFPIAALTFDEASELAYFGAKILHPSTIVPAQKYSIPVRLKNTMDEAAPGTIISDSSEKGKIKAIAAKDQITAIKIKSSRMLLAYGFLRRIFEVFEKHHTSIDMISTSEVAVSVTIDDNRALHEISEELMKFGTIEIDHNQTIICIVGNKLADKEGVLKLIFNSLGTIPVRMVSFGGSKNNISLLIETPQKEKALNLLNEGLFEAK
ncbi:MAG TPA: aspartate kinase [Cytophagales bacterium]|nr:aspartate kinase [Cytophagales bacterium]HCR54277.1 aspartate kinase [Cytophagales bacterium]